MAEPMPGRRRLLALAGGCACAAAAPLVCAAAPPTGWLQPPLPSPPIRLLLADGRRTTLAEAVAGKVCAVQLMFTGCGTTCPTQGAFFAEVARRLGASDARLLSISIDALGDSPARLRAWQERFGLTPAWQAAVAEVGDVDRVAEFLKGASGRPGTHTAQAFVFDRHARLCWRSGDWPGVGELESSMVRAARPG